MDMENEDSRFHIGQSAQERSMSHVPECYVLSPPQPPGKASESETVPTIDMGALRGTAHDRSLAVEDIGKACRETGFFQVRV